MRDITKLLREADPLNPSNPNHPAGEEGLSPSDAARIRRVVMAEVPESAATPVIWRRPFVLAAAVAVIVGLGGLAGHRMFPANIERSNDIVPVADSPASGDERRQLQFATPGGTRIIWVFDQNIRLQESIR
jgi:hypothetical protein